MNTRLWVGLLLAVYVFIDLIPPGLVPHSEHDHLGFTDLALEKDPCHISIFHPGESGGCNHKFHFTKQPGDCPLCHVTLVRQISIDQIFDAKNIYSVIHCQSQGTEGAEFNFPKLHADRGPPAADII